MECKMPQCPNPATLRPVMCMVGKCPDPKCHETHVIAQFEGGYVICEGCRYLVSLDDILPAEGRKMFEDKMTLQGSPKLDWIHSTLFFQDLPPENTIDFARERALRSAK